jgi:putative phage-type endonuclease
MEEIEIVCDETVETVGASTRISSCQSHLAFGSDRLQSDESESDTDTDCEDITNVANLKPSEFYNQFVARTQEQCEHELQAPQKSQEWLNARKLCITASQFGAAVGLSPYQTPQELVAEKVWATFRGNAATQWGNTHEPHAKEAFCAWFQKREGVKDFVFVEHNLMKYADEPWMAVSPDGIVSYTLFGARRVDLVEFKCPAYLRNTRGHPYSKHPRDTPPHYEAQMQGIMGYLQAHSAFKPQMCWFVVWQPHQTWITEHPFDPAYYDDLHAKLQQWYFTQLLPALCHKHNGVLLKGLVEPPVVLQ